MRSGANYGNRMMKRKQGLVWRELKIKQLNTTVLSEHNISLVLVEEWYK